MLQLRLKCDIRDDDGAVSMKIIEMCESVRGAGVLMSRPDLNLPIVESRNMPELAGNHIYLRGVMRERDNDPTTRYIRTDERETYFQRLVSSLERFVSTHQWPNKSDEPPFMVIHDTIFKFYA